MKARAEWHGWTTRTLIMSPLQGSISRGDLDPGLTPWATLCRPFGAYYKHLLVTCVRYLCFLRIVEGGGE